MILELVNLCSSLAITSKSYPPPDTFLRDGVATGFSESLHVPSSENYKVRPHRRRYGVKNLSSVVPEFGPFLHHVRPTKAFNSSRSSKNEEASWD